MIPAGSALPTAVVVGRGRLGSALGEALPAAGAQVELLPGRDVARRPELAAEALGRAGDGAVLLLAVRDDAVVALAELLAGALRAVPRSAAVLHHSGALGLEALAPLSRRGLGIGSCHPLQTFTGSGDDAGRFRGAAFAVDGDGEGRRAAEALALSLGGRPLSVPRGGRVLYHLAASLSANGLTALVAAGRDALVAAGLDGETALAALAPLLRSALEEAVARGPEAALTGPAARGDEATLARHRAALLAWDGARAALFEALLREQRRLAAREGPGSGC